MASDNKRKKKADGKRVALKQQWERDYLLACLQRVRALLDLADINVLNAREQLDRVTTRVKAGCRANRGAKR